LAPGFTTRFAPAPTGYLHIGHVVNALHVWGLARAFGGRVLLRIEDHDRGRARAEFVTAIEEDLAWLGFVPDERVPAQSERLDRYGDVLSALEHEALAYPCDCSRRDLARIAPDESGKETRYPNRCRTRRLAADATPARRGVMEPGGESFDDLRLGPQLQSPFTQCGDVLVRDRLGHWTYQFAVTVDDFDQGVDVVIRGEDLLASTGRQLRLAQLIGRRTMPQFYHHGLVHHPDGEKLSKSRGDTGVRELRAAGMTPAEVLGTSAVLGGLKRDPRPITIDEVAAILAG
jgi:glutamyl-tRNA synthetase/glutamyl-Q tRNA(Asp) synthetase